jgi:hypothetical protein
MRPSLVRPARRLLVVLLALAVGPVLASGTVAPAQALTPSAFLTKAAGPAQAGQQTYHVPASVSLGQAILESAWGESSLTREGHAFFGIKCSPGGDNGPFPSRCLRKVTGRRDQHLDQADRDHGQVGQLGARRPSGPGRAPGSGLRGRR